MFTDDIAIPRAASITLGIPRPTASASPASWIASTSWSTRASGDDVSVGRVCTSPSTPSSKDATATLVPPTSTPITLAMERSLSNAERQPQEAIPCARRQTLDERLDAGVRSDDVARLRASCRQRVLHDTRHLLGSDRGARRPVGSLARAVQARSVAGQHLRRQLRLGFVEAR